MSWFNSLESKTVNDVEVNAARAVHAGAWKESFISRFLNSNTLVCVSRCVPNCRIRVEFASSIARFAISCATRFQQHCRSLSVPTVDSPEIQRETSCEESPPPSLILRLPRQ